MKESKHTRSFSLKHIVFVFFALSLFFPLIQQHLNIIKEKPLEGFFKIEDYPKLSIDKWRSGEFQKQFETASNDHIGFHDFFIELQSQINYSIFNISKIQSVVVGKENYLYVTTYIDALTGKDFLGSEYISLQVDKAVVVSKELKKKNIDLILAIAPGKGSYFPEYIPTYYKISTLKDSTNYNYFQKKFQKAGVNFIDLRKYFLNMKDTIKYPLYSQVGVHLGEYASILVADTIIKKIEQIRNVDLQNFYIERFEQMDTISHTDRDAEALMNTLFPLNKYKMIHPIIKYKNEGTHNQPKLLAIADSYFSNIIATGIIHQTFSSCDYWLYGKKGISDSKLRAEIEKYNVVLLLSTDATLDLFSYGFIDQAYEAYAKKDKNYYEIKNREFRIFVKNTLENIKTKKSWQKSMIKVAKKATEIQKSNFLIMLFGSIIIDNFVVLPLKNIYL